MFYLLDSRRDITEEEIDVINYVNELGYEIVLLFTKCDKLKQSERAKLMTMVRKHSLNDYLFVSVTNQRYLNDVKAKISSFVE